MIDLFGKLAKDVAKNLEYEYPDEIDQKVTEYYKKVKTIKVENEANRKRLKTNQWFNTITSLSTKWY